MTAPKGFTDRLDELERKERDYDALAARLVSARQYISTLPCKCVYLGDGDTMQCGRCVALEDTADQPSAIADKTASDCPERLTGTPEASSRMSAWHPPGYHMDGKSDG